MPGDNTKSHLKTIRVFGKQEKINQIFSEENLVPAVLTTRWGNILPCIHTEIAGVFYNSMLQQIFTIDIHCLIRQWDITTGICMVSYPLEKLATDANE